MKKSTKLIAAGLLAAALLSVGIYALRQLQSENKDYEEEAIQHEEMMVYRPTAEFAAAEGTQAQETMQEYMPDSRENDRYEAPAEEVSQDNPTVIRLTEDYPDAVGWISVPGTRVDYAFVQGPDNFYYLRKGLNRQYLYAGTIYIDVSANKDFTSFNTVFYGHNLRNSTMFGDLAKFQRRDFFAAHDTIVVYLPHKTIRAKIIACVTSTVKAAPYLYSSEQTEDFMAKLKKGSQHFRDPEYENPSFLTLSTCGYDYEGERIIIVAAYEGD